MAGLKQHAFPIAIYTLLTIVMMIQCECDLKKGDHIFERAGMYVFDTLNSLRCRNVNFTEELYTLYDDDNIDFVDLSDSIISTSLPFKNACIIRLINTTFNIPNTNIQFWNEIKNLSMLSIRSSNLSTFDFYPIPSLINLDLADNALISLNTTNFRNFKLNKLNVSSNRLSNMYCENVAIKIDLSNNGLDIINCKFAKTLIYLHLNNNNLRNISIDAFKDMHDLVLLNLNHNHLDEVAHIFSDLENLIHLHLSNNNIYRLHIGCFANLKLLESLDLSYNEIVSLPHGIFNELEKLEILDLSYNDIFELNVGIFYSLHKLYELYLEGNFLKDLDINYLNKYSSLQKISFTFADISCHKLRDYVDILENKTVEIKSGPNIYLDNVIGIKCTTKNATDLYKSSFEMSLTMLKKVHVTLTIIAICFLVIMLIFVVIQYYRYKM